MYSELEQLSKTLDFISPTEGKRIIKIVNSKIFDAVNAHIIDVLWRKEGRGGAILDPYTYIDKTSRGGPKANPVTGEGSIGCIWTWVFNTGKPCWIEKVRSKNLNDAVREEASGEFIDPHYLDFFERTDSMLALPIVIRDSVRGVYTIELPTSDRLSLEVLDGMRRLAFPIANIIWKTDAYRFNRDQTIDVIEAFENSVRVQDFDFSTRHRAGFIARPFTAGCEVLERGISGIFRERGVVAQSYQHTPGSKFVLEDLKNQIRDCHFAVVDITGLNLNVLAEIGMLISLDKQFVIFRDERDEGEPPFDIRAYHYYRYRVDGGTAISVRSPWSELSVPLAQVVTRFIDELIQRDPAFAEAKPKG